MRILTLLLMLAATGCSRFDRDWTAAAGTTNADSIEGAWTGRWQSDAGHGGGTLRAIVTKRAEREYAARFEATFWGFLRGRYQINLATDEDGKRITGEEDLGFLAGGVYDYEGTIAPDAFDVKYRSKHDHGTFTLTRPGPSR